ncbi:recombinase family protein [Paragemmobacter straminiformis]|uniref:Recombinase family protein n=1 Tax=Paragemmobacter straminiformis TaxID=2045119 RepID=A0A842I078_9RHOB|nr:recombinase family protein [Gemmobacter straminiformis]MBC2834072.1 recombinase family protein [Gemmobacter straminiformis]
MTKYMNLREKAVGYTRVSTNLQVERDDSLERQTARIRQAARDNGWELLGIYDDVASAVGKDSLVHRPGLGDALALAAREDAFIIVTEPTRLFRNRHFGLKTLRASGAKIYSLKDQCFLSRKKLGEAFRAGEDQAEVTRDATSKAMAKSARLSRPSKKAGEHSRVSRKIRSEEIAEQIADILELDPHFEMLKHREFAEILNARGLRSGWGRMWNAASVRDRRARAMEILHERRAADDGDDDFAKSRKSSSRSFKQHPAPKSGEIIHASMPSADAVDRNPRGRVPPDEVDSTDQAFRDNPLFGLF